MRNILRYCGIALALCLSNNAFAGGIIDSGGLDLVFDNNTNTLYYTRANGTLGSWNLITRSSSTVATLGGTLGGISLDPDGGTIWVAQQDLGLNGASGSTATVHAVDTGPFGVSNLQYTVSGQELGTYDIAAGSGGRAFFTTNFSGSGWNPLHEIDTETWTISNSTDFFRNSRKYQAVKLL